MAENNDLILSRSALTSVEAARSYLQRDNVPTEDFALTDAVNEATALMESITQRLLRERLFVNTQAMTCVAVADSYTLTGTGLTALRAGMDIVGVTMRPEAQIASIATNGLSLLMTVPAAAAGSQSLTFGSAPLLQQWPGGAEIVLDQFPCEAVYSVSIVESDGTKTPIDITNAILRKSSGVLRLVNEWPSKGEWVEIEARAGYRPPTATDRGHPEDWRALRRICHRILQVMFQDYRHQIGRSLEVQLNSQLVRFADMSLPKDIAAALADYVREEV